jgi:hypothetical protein
VSGLLHFTLKESKSYKYIEIRFHGGALVQWTEEHTSGTGENQTTHTVTYQSEETYIHEARILWSSDQTPYGKIGPGTFDLPFEFVIPPNCLGSFKGSVGSISYTLHGLIKTGLLHRDHTTQVPIQVNKIVDINVPRLLIPAHQSKKKQVGFFCFGSDVEFTVSLSRTGFCIGQSLPLIVSVVNGSSRRIKMRASIQRNCHYHAQGSTNHDKRILTDVVTHDIAPHSQQTGITIEHLTIPMVEPSFTESQIIEMQYYLKVIAVIPWARNSSVKIPITLGNVPLNNTNYYT